MTRDPLPAKNKLSSVMVAEDRHSGVLTLSGIVDDDGHRTQGRIAGTRCGAGVHGFRSYSSSLYQH